MTSEKKSGLIQQLFLRLPLKTLFLASTGVVILMLTAVTILGVRQYILYQHCEQVVTTSRQLLFRFSSIKEHISEALITKEKIQFTNIHKEIEELENDIARINNDILIPEEFKQGFITQVDLVGLVVKLRTVQEGNEPSPEQLTTLTALLRSLFGQVTRFHQGLSSYTQALLLGLHKTVVGCLALVIFVVSSLLFLINKSISNPILQLGHTVREINQKTSDAETDEKPGLDVSIQDIINTVSSLEKEHLHLSAICSGIALYETLAANAASPTERWQDICSVLQTNGDYCLVWVGTISQDNEQPQPVSACGCLAPNEAGCLDILDHLLKYCKKEGGLCDSANKTIETGKATVSRIVTASLPESLRNLLPFDDDTFSSASFPIRSQHDIIAVITLYSHGHNCFSSREQTLLSYFFNHLFHEEINPSPSDFNSIPVTHLSINETLSRIYRYSTLGSLTTGLAHELTDLSNGAINYTQALLDLIDEQGQAMNGPVSGLQGRDKEQPQASESIILLKKLLTEEKKISRMAVDLQQFSRDTSENIKKFTVQELLQPIDSLTRGLGRTEGIELEITIAAGLPVIPQKGNDIQLVILSLIQNAKNRILEQYPAGRHGKKNIQITATLAPQVGQILITIQDHGATLQANELEQVNPSFSPEPWLALHQCKLLLQNLGGDLVVEATPEQHNIYTCILPC
ncbi:MAG: hypothetical protein ABIJ50_13280 [Pseudomonadota bacterium]